MPDNPSPEQMAAAALTMLDGMKLIAEVAAGYRKTLMGMGFSADAADAMCVDFHKKMMDAVPTPGQGARS